jgi:hypothetical protein
MNLSWKTLNRMIWLAATSIVATSILLPFQLVKMVESIPSDSQTTLSKQSLKQPPIDRPNTDRPTSEDIVRASQINLQRMLPPQPKPPPPQPAAEPVVVVPPPPPPPTVLFHGSLIGTIEDGDPKYCYAILQWPDSRISLLAKGESLSDDTNSPKIESITSQSITLKQNNQEQTLEVPKK